MMFCVPSFCGIKCKNESWFQTVRPETIHGMTNGNHLIDSLLYLISGYISKLQGLVLTGRINFTLNHICVDHQNTKLLLKIHSRGASTIHWGGICDSMTSSEFHDMARKCSTTGTIHHIFSREWKKQIKGSFIIDSDSTQRRNYAIGCRRDWVYLFSPWLLRPPAADPIRIGNTLSSGNFGIWRAHFFVVTFQT